MNTKDFEKKLQDMEDRLDHEVKELKETIEADNQQIEELREEVKETERAREAWQKQTETYAKDALAFRELKTALGKVLGEHTGATNTTSHEEVITLVEKEVRKILGLEEGAEIPLEHVKKVIKVKRVLKHLPATDTSTPKGKVLQLVADGFFEKPRFMSEIQKAIPSYIGIRVDEACKSLIQEGFILLGKHTDKRKTYQRDPDVVVEMVH